MQRMSPEEIARMQQLAANMDPSVMASAARSMQSLRPEDMRMASEQVCVRIEQGGTCPSEVSTDATASPSEIRILQPKCREFCLVF